MYCKLCGGVRNCNSFGKQMDICYLNDVFTSEKGLNSLSTSLSRKQTMEPKAIKVKYKVFNPRDF